jgi:uncharacterized repeat protein (TIGR03803 family)
VGGNDFYLWQQDGATWVCCGNAARSTYFTMNGNHTMTAVYGGIGIIGLSATNLTFGQVQTGAQATREFTIQSQGGNQDLHVSRIIAPFGFSLSWSNGTIPLNSSTNVYVTFSPTTGGLYSSNIIINCDATMGPTTIAVSGTGIIVPPPPGTRFPVHAFDSLYTFTGYSDGGAPCTGLVQDPSGYLYGTTTQGGGYGDGVIFRMTPSGTNSILHEFGVYGGGPGAQLGRVNT